MHVLILCEDEMLRELLGQTMSQEGLLVTEAAALCDVSLSVTPDAIVMDGIGRDAAVMGTLSGIDVVFPDGVPPVVLLVGSVASAELCAHPHVTRSLRAPFRAEQLADVVVEAQRAHERGLSESGLRLRVPSSDAQVAGLPRLRRP